MADGVVVTAVDGRDAAPTKNPDEKYMEYFSRMSRRQNQMLKEDSGQMSGNYIVIKHSGDEYSSYAHMVKNSISVKEGDGVKRGVQIGRIGTSGNSLEPHLHFQVMSGPNPMTSRGLPITFGNIFGLQTEEFTAPLKSGDIVETRK